MFYVYVLESLKNGQLYKGFTSDLRKRLKEHNQGLNPSTKRYRPWQCIYYEACLDKNDAVRREGYLKTTQGMRLLKRRLKDYFYEMSKDLTSQNFTTG
ncbi:MAG TPA: GIY-YIG nuclease family protein [Candidatus Paceibacterota bacterium]